MGSRGVRSHRTRGCEKYCESASKRRRADVCSNATCVSHTGATKHPSLVVPPNTHPMQQREEASDVQLIAALIRYGDVGLAELYQRHGDAVYGLARRVLEQFVRSGGRHPGGVPASLAAPRSFRPRPGHPAVLPSHAGACARGRRHSDTERPAAKGGGGRPPYAGPRRRHLPRVLGDDPR